MKFSSEIVRKELKNTCFENYNLATQYKSEDIIKDWLQTYFNPHNIWESFARVRYWTQNFL